MLLLKVISRKDSTVSKPGFIFVVYLCCDWHTDKSLMLCLPRVPRGLVGRHIDALHQRLIMPDSHQCAMHVSQLTFLLHVHLFHSLIFFHFSSFAERSGLCHGFPAASLCPSTLSPRSQRVGDNIMMCVRCLRSEYTSGGKRVCNG